MAADVGTLWSRRKAAVRAEVKAEASVVHAAETARVEAAEARRRAAMTDEEILAELGLRDPDQMETGDDFAAFLSRAVPEHLRRRALRRLWRSNPVLANLDGLVDHGEDYTAAATVLPDMKTTYQVGKGLMPHVMALTGGGGDAERSVVAGDAGTDTATEVAAMWQPEQDEARRDAAPGQISAACETAPQGAAPPETARPETTPRTPRHMRFAFVTEG